VVLSIDTASASAVRRFMSALFELPRGERWASPSRTVASGRSFCVAFVPIPCTSCWAARMAAFAWPPERSTRTRLKLVLGRALLVPRLLVELPRLLEQTLGLFSVPQG
jgi:hypothetical protein